MNDPDVSFVVPARNAARTIEAAVSSALAQEGIAVEVIVVDDGSTDDTAAIAERMAASDERVRVLRRTTAGGPSAARNLAIDEARGRWIAVLDADDLVAPERSRHLVALAEKETCDMVADNLMHFLDENSAVKWPFLPLGNQPRSFAVSLADYLHRNRLLRSRHNLGYLQPLFARSFLNNHGLRYDEDLRIGEDFDFCLRALTCGARYVVTTAPFYLYRMRQDSLSRQLLPSDVQRMMTAFDAVLPPDSKDRRIDAARDAYRRSLSAALDYDSFRTAVRGRNWQTAVRLAATRPELWRVIASLALMRFQRRAEMQAAYRAASH